MLELETLSLLVLDDWVDFGFEICDLATMTAIGTCAGGLLWSGVCETTGRFGLTVLGFSVNGGGGPFLRFPDPLLDPSDSVESARINAGREAPRTGGRMTHSDHGEKSISIRGGRRGVVEVEVKVGLGVSSKSMKLSPFSFSFLDDLFLDAETEVGDGDAADILGRGIFNTEVNACIPQFSSLLGSGFDLSFGSG